MKYEYTMLEANSKTFRIIPHLSLYISQMHRKKKKDADWRNNKYDDVYNQNILYKIEFFKYM